jgi:glutathione S-transferase
VSVALLQFPYSHFNEKARWALDYKGVVHERHNLLPGPHIRTIKRLTGLTHTPVLIYNDEIIPGSHNIIMRLEDKFPDTRRLLPEDRHDRSAAISLAQSLDEIVGPPVRTCVLAAMLPAGHYVPDMYSEHRSPLLRFAYRTAFPLAKPLTQRGNGVVNAEAVETARRDVEKNLDRLAALVNDHGFLIGARFSIADLTAASMFAPLLEIPHPDMHMPHPLPEGLVRLHDAFKDHPMSKWVLAIYQAHR